MNSGWPHFSIEELRCKCGCEKWDMNDDFMERLEALRVIYNKPMKLSSAYRCKEYDKKISNKSGAHTTGHSVDVRVYGENAYKLLKIALSLDFTGTGIGQTGTHNLRFLHLDDLPQSEDRNRPWVWGY